MDFQSIVVELRAQPKPKCEIACARRWHPCFKCCIYIQYAGAFEKFNYANMVLSESSSKEHIGVARRDGSYRYFPWLGFIELNQAKALKGSTPVKLEVHSTSLPDGVTQRHWAPLPTDRHVQGCLVAQG